MATTYNYSIRVSCGKLLEDLELTLTPFTIVIGAPYRRKATLLKSLYFATKVYTRRQPSYILATLFPSLHRVELNVEIDNYYVKFDGHEIVEIKGSPPWRYTVYIPPDYPTIVRMMLEAAEFVERFKRQHDAVTMLGGLASILATTVERYGRHTFLSRLALWACDMFVQAGLDEMCKSWRQALNSVFFGLGAQALTTTAGLSPADTTLPDYDIYRRLIEALLMRSKNDTIMLIENIGYHISLKNVQELVKLRVDRGDNIAVVASITVPPGVAKSLEGGEVSRNQIVGKFQAFFEIDLDPSISSLYLFKRGRDEGRIVAERLFP